MIILWVICKGFLATVIFVAYVFCMIGGVMTRKYTPEEWEATKEKSFLGYLAAKVGKALLYFTAVSLCLLECYVIGLYL